MSVWPQTVIAMVWDFDQTLIRGSMISAILNDYQIPEDEFWNDVSALADQYAGHNLRVDPQSMYPNHLLTLAWNGRMSGLNNARLRSYGEQLAYYEGMPDFLHTIAEGVAQNPQYERYGIAVEHYIVSSGLRQIIEGSEIRRSVRDVWATEFIESPIGLDTACGPIIAQIGYPMSDSVKTRALFELNKGTNIEPSIDINGEMAESERRIPFSHMICVADGPSDVPLFAVVKRMGGKAFGVYDPTDHSHFDQASLLLEQGRTNSVFEADYRPDRPAVLWLTRAVRQIADNIVVQQEALLRAAWTGGPGHASVNPV